MPRKVNPWAICHSKLGKKKTDKFERCVMKIKSKHGIKEARKKTRCWKGYKPTPGKTPYSKGSCMKEQAEFIRDFSKRQTESIATALATGAGERLGSMAVKLLTAKVKALISSREDAQKRNRDK